MSNFILQDFDNFVEMGLKPIPLKSNSKQPLNFRWNENWDYSETRWLFRCNPSLNIGFLSGEVIDVEGDTPEANKTILRLIGEYPHPAYRSRKSIHHLFLSPDKSLRRLQFNGIEFRGYGHQSVLPPSEHEGIKYEWLDDNRVIPPMPKDLENFYFNSINKLKRRPDRLKPEHIQVWCAICRKKIFLHQKRFSSELEIFKMMNMYWQCQKCREIDMRPLVRKLRRGTLTNK